MNISPTKRIQMTDEYSVRGYKRKTDSVSKLEAYEIFRLQDEYSIEYTL